jgi:hypothetical protein
LSRTHAVLAQVKAIPAERLGTKLRKTVAGVVIAGVSVLATHAYAAPWWVAVGGCIAGATVWSGELVLAPLKLLAAVVLDVVRRVPPSEGAG